MKFLCDLPKLLHSLWMLLIVIPCKRLFGPGAAQRIREASSVDPETGLSVADLAKKGDEVPLSLPVDDGSVVVKLPGAGYRLRYDRVGNIIYTPIKNQDKHE